MGQCQPADPSIIFVLIVVVSTLALLAIGWRLYHMGSDG